MVIAIINAVYTDISRDNSNEMPIIELFGAELRFMLRDVIYYSGNYDDIFFESHNVSLGEREGFDRGFNTVTDLQEKVGAYSNIEY